MQLKTLIIFAVIAIISVGFAYMLISKGYIRLGKPGDEKALARQQEAEEVEVLDQEIMEEMKEIEAEIEAEENNTEVSELVTVPLDPVIVNLKDSFGRRYLKVTVNLGIEEVEVPQEEGKKKKKKEEEVAVVVAGEIQSIIEGKLVEIRDVLISILSAKTMEEVDGWANQDKIRDEIRDKLNKDLGLKKAIKKVFFTEFVVQ